MADGILFFINMKYLFFLIAFCGITKPCFGQKYDARWLLGQFSETRNTHPLTSGNITMNFNASPVNIYYEYKPIDFYVTDASICEPTTGRTLFYTNGIYIADSTDNMMQNGDSINCCNRHWDFGVNFGYALLQGAIILPSPANNYEFYLFHMQFDCEIINGHNACFGHEMLYSKIDMRLNNGKGRVVLKNQLLTAANFNYGMVNACKHANGRDWWVLTQDFYTHKYYRYLLTPNGIQNLGTQQTEGLYSASYAAGGVACFSPDGTKYANFDGQRGFRVYDFDRCTGSLSLAHRYPIDTNYYVGSVAFSPNSRYLYGIHYNKIYQIDMQNYAIDTVAYYDGFTYHAFPNSTDEVHFAASQLAPDGKIYINTWETGHYLHTIENPNAAGAACDVRQHSVRLPAVNQVGMPNFPYYRLGALAGSPCDTLTSVGESPLSGDLGVLRVFPNPVHSELFLECKGFQNKKIIITDVLGRPQKVVPLQNETTTVNIQNLANGIYYVSLYDENGLVYSRKLVVQHE
jgi:hypothetical protein